MAAGDPAQRQPPAARGPVPLDRFDRVRGTGGIIAARSRKQGRDSDLVPSHEKDQKLSQFSRPPTVAARFPPPAAPARRTTPSRPPATRGSRDPLRESRKVRESWSEPARAICASTCFAPPRSCRASGRQGRIWRSSTGRRWPGHRDAPSATVSPSVSPAEAPHRW